MWSRNPLDCHLESILLMVIDPLFKFSLFFYSVDDKQVEVNL